METAWIQVFVLMLSECVAPAGKTVCQEREVELEFLTRASCESALEQLVELKSASDNVIVHPDRSRCVSSARESEVYTSLEAVREAHGSDPGWRAPDGAGDDAVPPSRAEHEERLASLPTCESTGGRAPCKVGQIIVEATGEEPVEVWKRED
jgi:hypothetical protein